MAGITGVAGGLPVSENRLPGSAVGRRVDDSAEGIGFDGVHAGADALLRGDELLDVLRRDPRLARHAEARAKEILDAVTGAGRRAQERRAAGEAKEREAEAGRLRSRVERLEDELAGARGEAMIAEQRTIRAAAKAEGACAGRLRAEEELEMTRGALAEAKRDAVRGAEAAEVAERRVAKIEAEMEGLVGRAAREAGEREGRVRELEEALEEVRAQVGGQEISFGEGLGMAARDGVGWARRESELVAEAADARRAAAEGANGLAEARLEAGDLQAQVDELRAAASAASDQARQLRQDAAEAEELLEESEAGRRELRARCVALGEKMDALRASEDAARKSAEAESEAARLALQDAVRDLEALVEQRACLREEIHNLKASLEAEEGAKKKLQRRGERQVESLLADVDCLRRDQAGKAGEVLQLQEQLSEQRTRHASDVALMEQQAGLDWIDTVHKPRELSVTRNLETRR
ncbi:unnamed protein product [Ostreobium quekettii]|uniref:Uncharacterized protein n=1 Tax=Ostreobium quekettii TaxID=121088 RepID=A0A8S1IUG8_9CHLO|nr:unnamed protein product [Ostreobium quekettii]|eukprot:evm.model.scf_16.16 EVM.evm.TU.scf_16.16   scf_16:180911-184638(+)